VADNEYRPLLVESTRGPEALMMAMVRWLAWAADEILDRVPRYEDGSWYWCGMWGCQLGLYRIWDDEPS
jgi:hypothetical protein